MKRSVTLLLLVLLDMLVLPAQSIQWGRTYGGSSSDFANALTSDAFGNVYTVSYTLSTNITIASQTYTTFGGGDIFIVKYRSNGQFAWAKRLGGTGNDFAESLVCDLSGNLYMCGYFDNTIVFGNDTLTSAGGSDIFLAKFDSTGLSLWAKGMGSSATGVEGGAALAYSQPDNSVVMVGGFS